MHKHKMKLLQVMPDGTMSWMCDYDDCFVAYTMTRREWYRRTTTPWWRKLGLRLGVRI